MSTAVTWPSVGQYVVYGLTDPAPKYLITEVDIPSDTISLVKPENGHILKLLYQVLALNPDRFMSKVQPGQVWVRNHADEKDEQFYTVVDYSPKETTVRGEPSWHLSGGRAFQFTLGVLTTYVPEAVLLRDYTLCPAFTAPDLSRFPNTCPDCKSQAYIGFRTVDCSNRACRHFAEP